MFKLLENSRVILRSRGVYREAAAYRYNSDGKNYLFARYGSGYIALYENQSTGVANIHWVELHIAEPLETDGLGRLYVVPM